MEVEDWAEVAGTPPAPRCPICNGDDLVFNVVTQRGALPEFQTQAECSGCGHVPVIEEDADVELIPDTRAASFPPLQVEMNQPPRGLRPGDIAGAVCVPRPAPRPAPNYLVPHEGRTRPT
jgi:hypothetical protein